MYVLSSVSTVPVLSPSTILSACPGDEVVINCDVTETTIISLQWEITLLKFTASKIYLTLSHLWNNTNQLESGLLFYAEWTSYSPLSAILTTAANLSLNGATVRCVAAGLSSSNPLKIRVTQIGKLIKLITNSQS